MDSPLYLPFKALVSTVRSMVFNEGEAQQLIEILSDKGGVIQDTWHKVQLIFILCQVGVNYYMDNKMIVC